MRVGVVVPAHNEQEHLPQVISTMPDFVDHIFVVDDASTDGTFEAASTPADARVTVIRHERNTGVGGAVVTGHRRALAEGCDISAVMAGDGQMDPAHLPELLEPLVQGTFDYAKGNRFFTAGSYAGMPRNRVVGNVLLSIATKFASGYYNLFDSQNGYTAITGGMLRRLPLDRIANGYSFENEMLIYLNILRARVIDVGIPARYGTEVSGIRLARVIPELLSLLIRGWARRVWLKYVMSSFGAVALLLLFALLLAVFAGLVAVWALIASRGAPDVSAGTATAILLPAMAALLFLAFALHLDMSDTPGTPVELSFTPAPPSSAEN